MFKSGKQYRGVQVFDWLSNIDSEEGSDMYEFASANVTLTAQYECLSISINDPVFTEDEDLQYFLKNEDLPQAGRPVKEAIFIGTNIYNGQMAVLDGYHRYSQLLANGDKNVIIIKEVG